MQPSLDEILEEVIMLRPVGRGMHIVESDHDNARNKLTSPGIGLCVFSELFLLIF